MEGIKEEIEDRETFYIGDVDMTFTDSITIDLGGITCVITAVESTHTDGSTLIYVPEEKVLFLGDCVYGRRYNGVYGYKKEYLDRLKETISNFDVDYYIISHEEVFDKTMMEKFWIDLEANGPFLIGEC